MKTLIVYGSKHHRNTEKIAWAIGAELEAEVKDTTETRAADLDGCDLVGFGSGIDAFDVYPELTALVRGLGDRKGQKAFVFSTCASNKDCTRKFQALLATKGFELVGEFHCPGQWTPLFFKIRGDHPDTTDLANAVTFARGLRRR
jgi:flavodoxin